MPTFADLTQFVSTVGAPVAICLYVIDRAFNAKRNGGFFRHQPADGKDLKTQTDIDIALLKQEQENLKSNHLIHQEAIEKWMEKHDLEHLSDRELMIKIAFQMGIKKIEN